MRAIFAAVLAAVLLACAAPCAAADDSAVAAIDGYFSERAARQDFSGAVLIAEGDDVLMLEPYGMADFELGVPVSADNIFRVGSLTKPVTAALVLEAVERGRLALDGSICASLDRCLPAWAPVTLADLLSHRSGIPDHFGDVGSVPVDEMAAEIDRAIGALDPDETLEFTPGDDYAYSNFNYVLLGRILEAAEGQGWRDLVRAMAEPLGAASIDYDDVHALLPGRLHGYSRDDNGEIHPIDYDDHGAYAAGGLRATIGDFFRWSRASLQARLFSPAMRDRMVTPEAGNYGFGWQVRSFLGERIYNHTGGIDGFSTHIAYYPDRDLTVIVFSNIEQDAAILSACDAAALYFDFEERRGEDATTIIARPPAERCGV